MPGARTNQVQFKRLPQPGTYLCRLDHLRHFGSGLSALAKIGAPHREKREQRLACCGACISQAHPCKSGAVAGLDKVPGGELDPVIVIGRVPQLLHIVKQLQAVDQSGIRRDHVEQRTKPFKSPRQRGKGRVVQDFRPVYYVLRKL